MKGIGQWSEGSKEKKVRETESKTGLLEAGLNITQWAGEDNDMWEIKAFLLDTGGNVFDFSSRK